MEQHGTTLSEADMDDLCGGLRDFLRAEVVPRQHKLEADGGGSYGPDGRFTPALLTAIREVREASAEAGFYTMLVPESLGGAGLGYEALYVAWRALFDFCGYRYDLGHSAISHWTRGPSFVMRHLTAQAQADVLPGLMSGRETLCFALSEPDAGSDLWRMKTTARRVDGGWRLNGTKQWITNSPYAEHVLVFAVTDPEAFAARRGGVTAFLVPSDAEGYTVDSIIRMLGHAGGDEGILSFTEVFVPDDRVVGEVAKGLRIAMEGVSTGRLYNAAKGIGLGRWALRMALDYASVRETFDRRLIENQAITFPCVDAAANLHAANLVGLDAARHVDRNNEARELVSLAKLLCTEAAYSALDHAIQVHGAMGFTNELCLIDAWHSMRRLRVADGSAETLRIQLARHLRAHGPEFAT